MPEDASKTMAQPLKCEVCGSVNVLEIQTKLLCRDCGYKYDSAEEPAEQ